MRDITSLLKKSARVQADVLVRRTTKHEEWADEGVRLAESGGFEAFQLTHYTFIINSLI